MDRDLVSRLAHSDHPIAAPLGDDAVAALLGRAVPAEGARVLDLGCGGGEWLLRALELRPAARAEGVDVARVALDHARREAGRRGLADRLVLRELDAATFTADEPFDVVLCVGSTHAFGGLLPALGAARKLLAPGGRVIVGEGYWERDPSPQAVEIFGDLADLPTTVDAVTDDGWVPVYGHLSTRHELDDYEWSWTGSLAARALDQPDVLATAAEHRHEWLRGYRDSFGFLTLVLTPLP
ncbi:SAM-dependent methyltransferase [Amycolatopsis thermophila]|uniref:SAM-dependent methyltransferase n=1 Tax=Amycolatopsis thermophila TaxID=206084 RepID=A0ABU0EWW9_9PSEU|nr:class I SAM-dependent methyltransferase [Amycolatopsis thermophila]MDQ0379820.1 SAM-dependent methyltransferase [Amycolatopsis thermophila]